MKKSILVVATMLVAIGNSVPTSIYVQNGGASGKVLTGDEIKPLGGDTMINRGKWSDWPSGISAATNNKFSSAHDIGGDYLILSGTDATKKVVRFHKVTGDMTILGDVETDVPSYTWISQAVMNPAWDSSRNKLWYRPHKALDVISFDLGTNTFTLHSSFTWPSGFGHGHLEQPFSANIYVADKDILVWIKLRCNMNVKVDLNTGVMENWGSSATGASGTIHTWGSAIYDGSTYIYAAPSRSSGILRIDTNDGSRIGWDGWPTGTQGFYKMTGVVLADTHLFIMPNNADFITRVDINDGSMIDVASDLTNTWPGGVIPDITKGPWFSAPQYDGQYVWAAPSTETYMLRIDPSTLSLQAFYVPGATIGTAFKFMIPQFDQSAFYLVPGTKNQPIVRVAVVTMTMTESDTETKSDETFSESENTKTLGTESVTVSISPPLTETQTDTNSATSSETRSAAPTSTSTASYTETITPAASATATFSDNTPTHSEGSYSTTKPRTETISMHSGTLTASETIIRPKIQEVFGVRIARSNLTLGSSFGNYELPSLRIYPSPREEIQVFTLHQNGTDIVIGSGWFYRFDQMKLTLKFTGGSTRSDETTICERSPCSIFTPIVSMGTTSYTIEVSFLERPESFSTSGRFVVDDLIVAGLAFDSFPSTPVHSHSSLELSVSLFDNFNFSLAGASDVISRENNVTLTVWDLNDSSNTIIFTQGLLLAATTFVVPIVSSLGTSSTRFGFQATVDCPSIYPVPCGMSTSLRFVEVVSCPTSPILLAPTSGILSASDVTPIIEFTNPSPTIYENTLPGAYTMTVSCQLQDTISGLISYIGSYQSVNHCTKQCIFSPLVPTSTPQMLQIVHSGHGKFSSDLTTSVSIIVVSSESIHRLHIELPDPTFPFEYSLPDPTVEGTIDLTSLCLDFKLRTSEGNDYLWPHGYSLRLWRSDNAARSNQTFFNLANDSAVFTTCLSDSERWVLGAPFASKFHLQTALYDAKGREVSAFAGNLTISTTRKQSVCAAIHPANLTALPNRLGTCVSTDSLHLHDCAHNTSLRAETIFPASPPESATARPVLRAFIGSAVCNLDGASPTYSNVLDAHGKLRSTTTVTDCSDGPEGASSSVVVAYDDGRYVEFDSGVSFKSETELQVSVSSISGCTDAFPNTGECSQTGAMPLTIHGKNFYPGLSINISSLQYDLIFPCTATTFVSTEELICTAYSGFGSGAEVLLYDARTDDHYWEVLSTPFTLSFATASETNCLDPVSGKICGGKGTCDGILGVCTCWRTETEGYWAGTHCSVCASTHEDAPSDTGCTTACPTGSDGNPCNSHGTCFAGSCTCDLFYRGAACNSKCPGAGAECSGHGVCDANAVCTCSGNFEITTACENCQSGFSGANCDLACPRNSGTNDICSNAGICTSGACVCNSNFCGAACETNGAACLDCPTAGLWGAGCDKVCPGGEATPCSGHGACSNGKTGDGSCFCDPGYWDTDCGEACPGGASTPCSGHGTCSAETGSCTCDPLYATASCGVYCPGAPTNVCSGHGTCSETSTGNGLCSCALGYTAADCSQTCPGGISSPCNGHGTCNADATCTCSNGPLPVGYWQGDECDECQPGWYGPECILQCPMDSNGDQCSSNGVCQSDATCLCYDDNDHGHFTGAACDDCKAGYYGAACLLSCPGGSCDTCSGHGNCSQGINGTGACTCDSSASAGYWGDWDCSICAVSHYGNDCTESCPGSSYLTGVTCNNHGWCWNGTTGSGACVCDFNWALGADGSCTECAAGFFGPSCAPCGRNATMGTSCSGHGTCNDGISGDGSCSCSFGFSGLYCEHSCPLASSGSSVCGQGTCSNDGSCVCSAQWRLASASTATADVGSCSQCISGFYGPSCSSLCPVCASGSCDEGPTGSGTCLCELGYWGDLCQNLCSGFPASPPCSGHGNCLQASGECSCHADTVNGFWAGTLCNTCADSHAGIPELFNCTKSCPAQDGTVCNGRGTCSDGVCNDCFKKAGDNVNIVCGYSCHIFDQECFASGCPQGFWGLECDRLCPAANDDGTNACNGRGFCDGDSGACLCNVGWSGTACDLTCPTTNIGGSNVVCLGRGQCLNGTCACSQGYWGSEKCEYECPGGAATPCNGYGTCGSDTGACVCDYGSIGEACQNECPGSRSNPCNGNGLCSSIDERCECYESQEFGYFTGDACQYCAAGFGGGNCTTICSADHTIPSTTSRYCNCAAGYGSPDCSAQCPGYDGGNSWCSGHGTCSEGSLGDGSCSCDSNYYGADCSIFCSPELCTTEAGLVNSACNSEGSCVCDTSIGQWAGQLCDECATGWWGGKCNLQCSCNSNGGCVQDSGDCVCFSDAINGYWAGTTCDKCLDGYIGLDCRSKNVQLSISAEVTASGLEIPDLDAPGMILTDMEFDIAYVGNRPLLLVDLSGDTVVTIRWLIIPSRIIGLHLDTALNVVVLDLQAEQGSGFHFSRYHLPRGGNVVTEDLKKISDYNVTTGQVVVYGRGMDVQSLSTSVSALCTAFDTSTQSHVAIYSDFTILLSSQAVGGTTYVHPASSHSLRSVTACQAANGSFTITGASASDETRSWRVLSGELPFNSATGVKEWSSANVNIPHCLVGTLSNGAAVSCTDSLRCIEFSGYMYCAMYRSDGPFLSRFSTTVPSEPAMVAQASSFPGTYAANALAIDVSTGVYLGFVSLTAGNSPSTLYKFSLSEMIITGVMEFGQVGSSMETVTGFEVDSTSRILSAIVQMPTSFRLMNLNLFGVENIVPSILDSRGGTFVYISGEGFSDFTQPFCRFSSNNNSLTEAVFINSTTLACYSSASTATGSVCDTVNFNIQFGSRQTAATNVPLQRPSSVVPEAAGHNETGEPYGSQDYSNTIVITGTGFVSSQWATCELQQGLGLPSIPLGAVKFINSTAVECVQSPTVSPSQPPSFLAYSHDGTILSTATTPYAILGAATGLAIVSPVTLTQMTSGAIAPVPKILVHVVDIKGNSVYRFDTSNTRTIILLIERFDAAGTATSEEILNSNTTQMRAVEGEALFNEVALLAPKEGTITVTALHITDTGATWDASIKLDVTVGRPSYITLVDSSGLASTNASLQVGTRTVLNVDVIARISDEAGNFVTDTSVMPPYLTLQYDNRALDENTGIYSDETVSRTANINGEYKYEFSQVPMRTTFGSAHSIDVFNSLDNYELTTLRFTRFVPQICGPAEYGVKNTFTCLACPDFGLCDGSSEVNVQEGYWRAAIDAYKFYECTAPYGAGACLTSRCKDGYEGPRCSVCSPGYGKTGLSCSKCLDPALSWFIIVVIAIFVIAVIFILVRQSAGDTEGDKEEKGQSALILKIAVSHLQMSALGEFSSDQLPTALKDFFRGSGAASTINPNFSFISCEIAPTFDQQIAFVVVTPFLLVLIFAIIEAIRVTRNVQIKNKAQELDDVYDEETRRNHRELMASGLDFSKSKSRSHGKNSSSAPDGIVATTVQSGVFSADMLRSSIMNKSAGIPNLSIYGKYSHSTSQERKPHIPSASRQKMKGRLGKWVDGFALNTVIIMFMLYPTIVETNSKMLSCDELDYGSEGSKRFLAVDRSISCDDPAYDGQRTLSLLFMFAFGLGIPVFSVFVVKLMQHLSFRGDMDLARRLFFFMTGSFREELWFWEGILLGRKAMLVLIVVLIKDDSLRSYCAMWLMSGFFVLNLKVKPWNHSTLHRLEASSLVCITSTYNLTLLMSHFTEQYNPVTFYFIVSLIFIINIVTLCLFIVAFRAAFKELAQKLATKFPNQFRWLVAALEPSEKERLKKIIKLELECNELERLIAETCPREVVLANAMREMAARFPNDPKAQALAKDYLRYVATASVRFQTARSLSGETNSDIEDFFTVETELLRRWLQLELERNSLSGWAYGAGQDKSSFHFDIQQSEQQSNGFSILDQGPLPQAQPQGETQGQSKNAMFSGMINVLNESEMSDFDFGDSKNDSDKPSAQRRGSTSTNVYVATPRSLLLGNTSTGLMHQGGGHDDIGETSVNSNSSTSAIIRNIPRTQAEERVASSEDDLEDNNRLQESGATSVASSASSINSNRPRLVRRSKSSIVNNSNQLPVSGPTAGLNLLQDF